MNYFSKEPWKGDTVIAPERDPWDKFEKILSTGRATQKFADDNF